MPHLHLKFPQSMTTEGSMPKDEHALRCPDHVRDHPQPTSGFLPLTALEGSDQRHEFHTTSSADAESLSQNGFLSTTPQDNARRSSCRQQSRHSRGMDTSKSADRCLLNLASGNTCSRSPCCKCGTLACPLYLGSFLQSRWKRALPLRSLWPPAEVPNAQP